jgi:subtilisin-like proprotein convertase family protein
LILETPAGEQIVLQERSGGAADDLVHSYRSTDMPETFEPVLGASAQGDWGLHVEDKAPRDVGVLAKWGLAITYRHQS